MESGAFRAKVLPNVKVNNNLLDLALLTHMLFYKANNKDIVLYHVSSNKPTNVS